MYIVVLTLSCPVSLSGILWSPQVCTVFQLRGSIYPNPITSLFIVYMESYVFSVKLLSSLVIPVVIFVGK